MKNLVFFILLSFSISAFSYPVYDRHPEFSEDVLVGHDFPCSPYVLDYFDDYPSNSKGNVYFYSFYQFSGGYFHSFYTFDIPLDFDLDPHPIFTNLYCHFVGWVTVNHPDFVSDICKKGYFYEYYCFTSPPVTISYFSNNQFCSGNIQPVYFPFISSTSEGVVTVNHSACEADCVSIRLPIDECGCPQATYNKQYFYLVACPLEKSSLLSLSQKTLQKTNDLISESNSKLGLISASNSANTGLLNDILKTLQSLISQNFGIFGADFGNSSNNQNFNNGESDSESTHDFLNHAVNLSEIPSLMPAQNVSQCPSVTSFTALNSTYSFSFEPVCTFANRIHSIVISSARVAAAFIVIGAVL